MLNYELEEFASLTAIDLSPKVKMEKAVSEANTGIQN
jgi:hypothetical protein